MKKTITSLMLGLIAFTANSQTVVNDFESFTLTPNSFYKDTNSVPFQTPSALFRHEWTNGQFAYWSGGFSYTNKNDTVNGDYNNVYNCRAYTGYNNSAKYVTGQDHGVIVVKSPYNMVDGFYITNTNYAYKSMKFGDSFAKKFGGTTGNDPDWFKITAKGYLNGNMKADSAEFYLADYRFTNNASDYIVQNWQWFNTSVLNTVDSVKFFMYSSDVGQFGINTPLFFSLDNVTVTYSAVGIPENQNALNLQVYPNPFNGTLYFKTETDQTVNILVSDITGKNVAEDKLENGKNHINLSFLEKGIYFVEVSSTEYKVVKKLIKN
ncbi:MAG: T9SS type A sorting domain-containing protein [Bacteroidia bacterium]